MGRHRLALLNASLTVVILAGCSRGPERALLGQFFAAARLADRTSLHNFTTVSFEPGTQGTVMAFEIVNIAPEERTPLTLGAVANAREDATAAGAIAAERQVVELSMSGSGVTPVDPTKYDGELVSKGVTITAPVRLPGGQTAQKTFVITMQRAVLKGDKNVTGRWIITAVRDASASPPAIPRS